MPVSLYQATVPTFLQVLSPLGGLIDKAGAWCADKGLPDNALTEARLASAMWGFGKQVTTACLHAEAAAGGVQSGETGPDFSPAPEDLAALKARVNEVLGKLRAVQPADLDGIATRDHCFRFGERRMDFTVADYLLSFALPNFFFHASMAYAILRNQGLPIGKMDFLGAVRLKG
jgi:uncharacterized protein